MLTALAIRNAKPKAKPYKLFDINGLYLLVTPRGGRYWRWNYAFDSKNKTIALGTFPTVSLAEARDRCEAAHVVIADGRDPMAERKKAVRSARLQAASTFRAIGDEWLGRAEREGRAPATLKKLRWMLNYAYPTLGDLPIGEITSLEILAVLRKLEDRGRFETGIRLRGTIGSLYRYAIATGRADRDPSLPLRGALITPKVTPRPAIIEPRAVGALLRAIDRYDGQPEVVTALQLMAHLFQRPGELRGAEWEEFDLDAAIWTIPPHKMKMRRRHRVPLSRQAIELLDWLHNLGGKGRFPFASIRSPERTISNNTLNSALRRLGYSADEMTAHGFRATASTLLNESGLWHPDAIERQLAHVESNDVRRAYLRGEHWDERVRMMQWWSDYLDQLKASTGRDAIADVQVGTSDDSYLWLCASK